MDAVCVPTPGTPPSTAAVICLGRRTGAPCPDIIDKSHYTLVDETGWHFARSGELKQRTTGLAWTA